MSRYYDTDANGNKALASTIAYSDLVFPGNPKNGDTYNYRDSYDYDENMNCTGYSVEYWRYVVR